MKKNLSIIFIQILLLGEIIAQEKNISKDTPEYKTELNILYRDKTKETLTEYMETRCRLDVYYPVDQKDFATVIWFHGGGLLGGERYIPDNLKNQKIAVVPVNYRLSPKVKCPAYIDDAAAAVAWVFQNIKRYGGNPDLIYISGHSAGGYLTLMLGLDKKWLKNYNVDADKIAGFVPFSGQTITHTAIRNEMNISDKIPFIDDFAPLNHVRADAPPLILITGDRVLDIPARYMENAYLFEAMKVIGHQKTVLYELNGFNHSDMVDPACYLLLNYVADSSKTINKK